MSAHRTRKRFGQHFLISDEVIERIVQAIAPQPGDTIVEIGPGRGAMTRPLVKLASVYHGIEFDRDLVPLLQRDFSTFANATIHEADALTFEFGSLGDNLRLVGNLPYNISTPLLFHLLGQRDSVCDMHFMLQKEVVERIVAAPGSKAYGRLTIMLGAVLESVALFDVPPEAFAPPPRVMSAVVRMRPLPQPHPVVADAECFASVVKLAFSRRRKTLRNALKGMVEPADLDALGLDRTARPEQVRIGDWIALANRIADNAGGGTES